MTPVTASVGMLRVYSDSGLGAGWNVEDNADEFITFLPGKGKK